MSKVSLHVTLHGGNEHTYPMDCGIDDLGVEFGDGVIEFRDSKSTVYVPLDGFAIISVSPAAELAPRPGRVLQFPGGDAA